MKKLLLHVCCAPCSTSVIERLEKEYELSVLFYNPNIHPETEYQKRLVISKDYSKCKKIPFIKTDYDLKLWSEFIKGTEAETEKSGIRCKKCIEFRMRETAQFAKREAYNSFTTTLSVSPHKNVRHIHEIGEKLGRELGIDYYAGDFKKKDGYKRSIDLSKEYSMYRQNYCGCIFSNHNK